MDMMRESMKDFLIAKQEPKVHFEEAKNECDSDDEPSKLMVLPKFDETMYPNEEMSCTDLGVFMEIRE